MNDIPLCVICLQEMCNELACTPCGHVFHKKCIKNSLHAKLSCPLCREKTFFTGLIEISFEIITTAKANKDFNDQIYTVLNEKIKMLEDKLELKSNELQVMHQQNEQYVAKIGRLQKKYSVCKGKMKNSEFQAEKFEALYTSLTTSHNECMASLSKLENMSKLINSLESSKTPLQWISHTIDTLPLPDQISHFQSALLITANSLKSLENTHKQLKQEHLQCEDKFLTMRKLISSLKQDQNTYNVGGDIESLPVKVIYT